jgi:hypothetical protein
MELSPLKCLTNYCYKKDIFISLGVCSQSYPLGLKSPAASALGILYFKRRWLNFNILICSILLVLVILDVT